MSTRSIQPGEPVTLYTGRGRTIQSVAGWPCSDTAPGHWYCASHPNADTHNNISMSSHCDGPGQHLEVWVCHEHGPESPSVIVRP
jgi:hypothetical protein